MIIYLIQNYWHVITFFLLLFGGLTSIKLQINNAHQRIRSLEKQYDRINNTFDQHLKTMQEIINSNHEQQQRIWQTIATGDKTT
jgi:flagellar capping protein FliD